MTEMIPATETGRLTVTKRRDALEDYRRLLNRWVVKGGRENRKLAALTLAVLDGRSYEDAIQ